MDMVRLDLGLLLEKGDTGDRAGWRQRTRVADHPSEVLLQPEEKEEYKHREVKSMPNLTQVLIVYTVTSSLVWLLYPPGLFDFHTFSTMKILP